MAFSKRFTPRSARGRRRGRDRATASDEAELDDEFRPAPAPVLIADEVRPQPTGALNMIVDFFKRRRQRPEERGAPAPSDDPVRRILSVPRGAERLDAFAQTLEELEPGTHGHRGVALAFCRELVSMAEHAGVALSLIKKRVEVCAEALVLAGEHTRAAELLSAIGHRHRAAELFVSAGAIDQLEQIHFDIEHEEGGPRLDARLNFDRFETMFLVGMRRAAIEALDEACRLWPDNAVYRDVQAEVKARALLTGEGTLKNARGDNVSLRCRWPIVIGRGEDATVRVNSPLLSRAHAEIALVDDVPFLRSLQDRLPVSVGGTPVTAPRALDGQSTLTLGTVRIDVNVQPAVLDLHTPERGRVIVPRGADVPLAGLSFRVDHQGVVLCGPTTATLNGEFVVRDILLMVGDIIEGHGQRYTVERWA